MPGITPVIIFYCLPPEVCKRKDELCFKTFASLYKTVVSVTPRPNVHEGAFSFIRVFVRINSAPLCNPRPTPRYSCGRSPPYSRFGTCADGWSAYPREPGEMTVWKPGLWGAAAARIAWSRRART